ncbi:hypothetical protein EG68_08416 [Paragonimus skrjabini miyazakii]|uniref:SH3 domain-containing protein n=1 Tax=Paragonimus skrjabini miyazakii TaxID=59628 RepID=A0A8S9YJ99_9TREM|nr:hypothetical protein EG68_08416 [Paragonimus skrjabini miyazakii]
MDTSESQYRQLKPTGRGARLIRSVPKIYNSGYHKVARWLMNILNPILNVSSPCCLKDSFHLKETLEHILVDSPIPTSDSISRMLSDRKTSQVNYCTTSNESNGTTNANTPLEPPTLNRLRALGTAGSLPNKDSVSNRQAAIAAAYPSSDSWTNLIESHTNSQNSPHPFGQSTQRTPVCLKSSTNPLCTTGNNLPLSSTTTTQPDNGHSSSNASSEGYFVALHDYVKRVEDDLGMIKGQTFHVLDRSRSDWWYVECTSTGMRGYVPRNHLAAVTSIESNE